MSAASKRTAKGMASALDKLIDEFLNAFPGHTEADKVQRFLWENKIGILRIIQAHAGKQD